MIIIACRECGNAIRVTGEHDEVQQLLGEHNQDWYPDKYPCPMPTCDGKSEFMDAIEPAAFRMLNIVDLTLHEAYAAFHGLGLPDERDCGPVAIRECLLSGRVKSVDVRLIRGSSRSVLYSITMEDGTTIHVGSSPFGAVVYRLAKPQSAVQRLDESASKT